MAQKNDVQAAVLQHQSNIDEAVNRNVRVNDSSAYLVQESNKFEGLLEKNELKIETQI